MLKYLDWKPVPFGGEPLKELEQFLLDRAMEHDTPSLLFHPAAEFLISAQVTRPGVVTLMEMVATPRPGAGALTSEKVDHLLTRQMRGDLDALLVHDTELGMRVPAGAPTSFVSARYADYLAKARRSGDDTAFRHYWELCTILALRDGLRSGDVFVSGSRRYADPGTYLFSPEQWEGRRAEFCRLVRKPAEAADALAQAKDELHQALSDLEETLAGSSPGDVGAVRLDEAAAIWLLAAPKQATAWAATYNRAYPGALSALGISPEVYANERAWTTWLTSVT